MTFAWRPNRRVLAQLRTAVENGLEEGAQLVYDASQDQVPVLTGDLARSGEVTGSGLHRKIVYTDPVAILVHENLTVNHNVGNAKFLEQPLTEKRRDVLDVIARRVRREVGR